MTKWDEYKQCAENAQAEGKFSYAAHVWLSALTQAGKWSESDNRLGYTLEKLCECLWYQGKFADAVPYCQKLILFHRKTVGDNALDTGSMIGNLAILYHAQSLYKEAEPFYRQSIAIKTQHLGANHPEVARLNSVYADVLNKLKHQTKDASELTARMWSRTGEHAVFLEPLVVPISNDIAALDLEQQWQIVKERAEMLTKKAVLDQAEVGWIQALSIAEKFSQDDPRLCLALEQVSLLYERQEKFTHAVSHARRALEIKKRVHGTQHYYVASALNDLSRLLYYACDFPAAEGIAIECLETYKSVFGKKHTSVAAAANNLAMLYHIQKKYSQAEPYYKQALSLRTQLLGSDHPDTIRVLGEYANLLKTTFREEEAERLQACVDGLLTGSWKQIPINYARLPAQPQPTCPLCGQVNTGLGRCASCGSEKQSIPLQPIST
jgi:tetratricopeptide (TPR) repeat protein